MMRSDCSVVITLFSATQSFAVSPVSFDASGSEYRNGLADNDAPCLPGTLNFGIEGVRRDTLLIRLDRAGFAISAGSACSAGSLTPSHVLSAMGLPEGRAQSSLRVTLGRFTTEEEVRAFAAGLRCEAAAIRNAC